MSEVFAPEINASAIGRPVPAVAWFCLRSQVKHEHIAAEHLRRMVDVEVFNPRVHYTRTTRLGPMGVTESMFPNYLFARFNWQTGLAKVHYAPGVSGIVHFGDKWPTVPERAIEEIRDQLETDGICELEDAIEAGETVEIAGRAFLGLQAVVTQVMPGKQRVMVLMDFLGRQAMVEVGVGSIIRRGFDR